MKSMADAAAEAGVSIVAGDTKVVERGKADGIFITTSGFGYYEQEYTIGGAEAKAGDVVLISGTREITASPFWPPGENWPLK